MLAEDAIDTASSAATQKEFEQPASNPPYPSASGAPEDQRKRQDLKSSRRRQRRPRPDKLAILVNTIAPYRVPVYGALAERFDTIVLHGGREANRQWKLNLPPTLKCYSVPTLQLAVRKQTGVAGLWDKTFFHLNIGLLWWLPLIRPDAIFTNELGIRTMAALAYGWLARVPVWVGWEGSLHSERHIDRGRKRLRRFLMQRIEHWVSFGSQSRDYLLTHGVLRERIVEAQNCVQQEMYQAEPSTGAAVLPEVQGPVLLTVGQLIPRKGVDKLLAACGRAAKRGRVFTLVVIGNGSERAFLEQEAKRIGFANLILLPNQPMDVLIRLYRRADVLMMPSLEDVWGLVVNEALWAGLPVLCSHYAGSAEALPKQNLFDPLSEESIDEAIEKALRGEVAPASTNNLMTWQEVSRVIGDSIDLALKTRKSTRSYPAALSEASATAYADRQR